MIKLAIIHFPKGIRLDTFSKRERLFAMPPFVGITDILPSNYTVSFIDLALPSEQEQAFLRMVRRHQEIENGYLKTTQVSIASSVPEKDSGKNIYFNNQGKALRGLHLLSDFIYNLPTTNTKVQPSISLSLREKQIMELLSIGMLNKEIADKLGISTNTVKNHTKHIYAKLGTKNRIEALRIFLSAKE